MKTETPFTLRIFVADGDPDGLRLVERSNWVGKAVMFPRALFPDVRNRPEFKQTGVYLLLGPRPSGDGETLYIGEGDPVRPRFEDHFAKKDFWTRAVFFVAGSGQLNKAHVQYLEAQMVALATAAKRMTLENGNNPAEPTLSEADRADTDVFLHNVLGMLPVLGIHAFEASHGVAESAAFPTLTCKGRGVEGHGQDTPQGFVVQTGSRASKDEVPSLKKHFPNVTELRTELQTKGVLESEGSLLRFTQNYTFSSPSLASAVVLGRPSNGREDWRLPDGRTLKQLQESIAKV
jgi:hypothetical protein